MRRYRWITLVSLLALAGLLTAQVATFPRWRLGGGLSGQLAEVDSSGNLLVTTSGTAAAQGTDPSVSTFARVRLAGASGTLAEVDSSGRLLVSLGSGVTIPADGQMSLSTSLTTPLLIGGTTASSTLTLKSTTGVGTTDAMSFVTGNNGNVEPLRLTSAGFVGMRVSAPQGQLHTAGYPVIFGSTFTDATAKFNSQGVAWSTFGSGNSLIFNDSSTVRPEIAWIRGSRTYPEFAIRQHTTNDTGGEIYAGGGTAAPTKIVDIRATGMYVVPPTTQTIAATNTITADACSGLKAITAAGAVTTNTTDTFTAPAAANTGCMMLVCNVGTTNTITLDKNSHFFTVAGADVLLLANSCIGVVSDGTQWRQHTAVFTAT